MHFQFWNHTRKSPNNNGLRTQRFLLLEKSIKFDKHKIIHRKHNAPVLKKLISEFFIDNIT